MLNNQFVIAQDGELEVVYSSAFNIQGPILKISFVGLTFNFNFLPQTDFSQKATPTIQKTFEGSIANITLSNFRNPVGASTIVPVLLFRNIVLPGIGTVNQKELYFSLKANL